MKRVKVSICSSANVINVQGFIDELSVKFPHLALDVQYFELPYNDIDNFTFRGIDVGTMILCHSINNRRFAITDVMDALYDRFLPYSAEILGKERICVLVHDFPKIERWDTPDNYEAEMETFKNMQGTTFKISGLVMMGGKLEGPVELQESNWEQLRKFLKNAGKSWWQRFIERYRNWWLALFIVVALALFGYRSRGLIQRFFNHALSSHLKCWVKLVGQSIVGQKIAQRWVIFTQICFRAFNSLHATLIRSTKK